MSKSLKNKRTHTIIITPPCYLIIIRIVRRLYVLYVIVTHDVFIESLGFKTSLWTHPFVNLECDKHKIGVAKGYFVNSTANTVDSVWWNGKASYVDFTNPEAAAWWSNDLRNLLAATGIDTLKFDAGESSWYAYAVSRTMKNRFVRNTSELPSVTVASGVRFRPGAIL